MQKLPHTPLLGVAFGCCGAFLFTVQDASFKWLLVSYSIAQIIFLRSFTTLIIAALWVRADGARAALKVGNPRLFGASFFSNISAWFCFYTGLSSLPLTLALCVFFLVPVMIALMSIPLLDEKPTWRQMAALLAGFGGVVIITNPFSAVAATDLTAVGWILAAVLLWAFTAVTTRKLQPSMTVAGSLFYTTAGFLIISGGLQWFLWRTPTAAELAGMLLIGIVSAGAQSCLLIAYRTARSAVVATSEYTALVWAALLGWLIWDEQLTPRDLTGAFFIVGGGLIMLLHTNQKNFGNVRDTA